jgi:hypothetical protein
VIDLTLRGATAFSVNGFAVDTRQVSPDGTKADPLAPVALLVFSPGLYSISVDTPVSSSPGVAVLSDTPQAEVPVDIQTQPTSTFVDVVQERVESFLTACTTQQVLQPTGCPFGLQVRNRILEPRCGRWSPAQDLPAARRRRMVDRSRGCRGARGRRHQVDLRRHGDPRRRGRAVPGRRHDHDAPDGTASIQVQSAAETDGPPPSARERASRASRAASCASCALYASSSASPSDPRDDRRDAGHARRCGSTGSPP